MADLDHFKQVNDRFGHAAGDTVLRAFAALLKDGARAADLPGRLGGEVFALMLPDTNAGQALQVAERIRVQLANLRPLGQEHRCTVSFGLAMRQAHGNTDHLLAHADHALYEAKDNGRNRVAIYHPGKVPAGSDAEGPEIQQPPISQ